MSTAFARSAYRQTDAQAPIHPVKLVHMMYERTLVHLEEAEAGIIENSPLRRGENLGKAIALITELYASIKEGDDTEAARFLRGLYQAILFELSKVSVSSDALVVRRAHSYIFRLKEIWDQTAMRENGLTVETAERGNLDDDENLEAPDVPSRDEKSRLAACISFSI